MGVYFFRFWCQQCYLKKNWGVERRTFTRRARIMGLPRPFLTNDWRKARDKGQAVLDERHKQFINAVLKRARGRQTDRSPMKCFFWHGVHGSSKRKIGLEIDVLSQCIMNSKLSIPGCNARIFWKLSKIHGENWLKEFWCRNAHKNH